MTLVCTATHLSCQLSDVRFRQALVQFEHVGKATSVHVLHDDGDGTVVEKRLWEGSDDSDYLDCQLRGAVSSGR